jgi:hypothetical protein
MKTLKTILLTILFAFLIFASLTTCKKSVSGCTSSTAINYNDKANKNDGSCIEEIKGCTDNTATNYKANANTNCCCTYSGNITFWTNKNLGAAIGVTLYVGQGTYINYITKFYQGNFPSCNASGCASFSFVPIGTYNYYAENSNGNYWNGAVTIEKNNCTGQLLY